MGASFPWQDGWWFDAWKADGIPSDRKYMDFAAAAKSGNAGAMVAVNPGQASAKGGTTFQRLYAGQDYTAGECWFTWSNTPDGNICPAKLPAIDAATKQPATMVWHAATFLGQFWGQRSNPRWKNDDLVSYVKLVSSQRGVALLDIPFNNDGSLYKPVLDQAIALRKAVRGDGQPSVTTRRLYGIHAEEQASRAQGAYSIAGRILPRAQGYRLGCQPAALAISQSRSGTLRFVAEQGCLVPAN